jgi:hypothetical protein
MAAEVSRGVRLGMLCLPTLGCLLVTASVSAQLQDSPDAKKHYDACLTSTSSNNVIKTSDHSIYTCSGYVAQSYYDFLVSNNAVQVVDKQPTGTYYFREIPQSGRCWNKIENAYDPPTSSYGCSLNVANTAK